MKKGKNSAISESIQIFFKSANLKILQIFFEILENFKEAAQSSLPTRLTKNAGDKERLCYMFTVYALPAPGAPTWLKKSFCNQMRQNSISY